MSAMLFHKPESALKRANELIAIGNQVGALELLQAVFANRRYKAWQKSYETLMIKFIDLCVDLQRHREAKDGLHQYRNMAQQQAPDSLEIIINHLIDQSEFRATNAKLKANAISAEEVTQIGDLEAEASPESIMLSTMTEEGGKERTDREVVVPWLKFLWEAYRAVLDILKTNTKLENVYHNTCIKAFNFCKTYARTTEFRRLCDTLRQHITNLQRHSATAAASRLRGWEGWTSENIELHLQTRFAQLEVAANLELWTEGFRTVEDIYNIMQISKKVPKARLMANYYEKLTRIFLVSENHLFHAYAWYKYYTLSREYNKALTPEERTQQACCVLLAALSIPEVKSRSGKASSAYDDDDLSKEKNQRMAMLLGFNTDPSRTNLLQELIAKGLLAQVPEQLRLLYAQLEVQNSPLTIAKNTIPAFEFLKASNNFPVLGVYVGSLERVIVLRMLEGLSAIYQTVSLDKFKSYINGLDIGFQEVEKIVVRVSKSHEIQVAIDYQSQCLRFTPAVLETDGMRSQLTCLARQLNQVVSLINTLSSNGKTSTLGRIEDKQELQVRKEFFGKVMSRVESEHISALARKEIIEKRKEETERREQDKIREAARIKAEEEARRREDEASRLAREAKIREKEKLQRMEEELAVAETKNMLNRLGKKVENIESMDKAERETAIRTAKDEIISEKDREEKRLKDQAKRMDYIVRAMRMEEMPVLQKKFSAQLEREKVERERRMKEIMITHREEWEKAIVQKAAVARMQPARKLFEKIVLEGRRAGYEEEVRLAKEQALLRHMERKKQRALQRKQEMEYAHQAEIEAEMQRIREEEEEMARIAAKEREAAAAKLAASEAALVKSKKQEEEGWQQAQPYRPPSKVTQEGAAEGSWRSGVATITEERRQVGFEERRRGFGQEERRTGGGIDRRPKGGFEEERRGSGFEERRGGGFEERRGSGFEERRGSGFEERRGSGFEERRGSGFEERRGGGMGGIADREGSWRRSGPPDPLRAGADRTPDQRPEGRPLGGSGRSLADLEKHFSG